MNAGNRHHLDRMKSDVLVPDAAVTWLGHATALLELDGMRVLTDPVLGNRVGPLVRIAPAVGADAIGRVDCVLLSHLHADHADLRSLRRVHASSPCSLRIRRLRGRLAKACERCTSYAPVRR
jgi:glyoxylase-like metal-dependent hydrolase (beta-lactamase superfamily II)